MRDKRLLLGVLFVLGMMLVGCGAPAPSVSGSFAGHVFGSEAFIAIVTNGTDVSAYVCDGTSEGVGISEWFKGTVAQNAFALVSRSDHAQLTGQLGADAASGTVTLPDGRELDFVVPVASDAAGLYAFKGDELEATAGWVIIIPEGRADQRGAVAFGGSLFHVPLDTDTSTANIPELGIISARKVTPENVERFFTNGWP
jgi:hypothetical protein